MKKTEFIHIRVSPEVKKEIEVAASADGRSVSNYILNLLLNSDILKEKEENKKMKKIMSLEKMEELVKEAIEDVCQAHGVEEPEEVRKQQQGAIDTIDYQNEKHMSTEEFKEYYKTWAEENTPWYEIEK